MLQNISARTWKWRPISAWELENEDQFWPRDRFQPGTQMGTAQNPEIETGDFGPELKWRPILAWNPKIETGDFNPELK
ncbi:uncharacterized protein OCT59_004451 [Rhizophagus irregularis]|uniref:uncharacterized protein n=1 Tax=Rhizophagus irregularis TaxID=588596 RepID=UPI00332B265E|nr:hypothetical protein OCT59_004451 [Rhizophagus irregularis]